MRVTIEPFIYPTLVANLLFLLAFIYLGVINGMHRSYYLLALTTIFGAVACILPLATVTLIPVFIVPRVLLDAAYLWILPLTFTLLFADWIDSVSLLHPQAEKYTKMAKGVMSINSLTMLAGAVVFSLDGLLDEFESVTGIYIAMGVIIPILTLLQLLMISSLLSSMKKHPYDCTEKRQQLIQLAMWYGLLFMVQIFGLLISPIYGVDSMTVGLIRAGPIMSNIFVWFLYISCIYKKNLMTRFAKAPIPPQVQTTQVGGPGSTTGSQGIHTP